MASCHPHRGPGRRADPSGRCLGDGAGGPGPGRGGRRRPADRDPRARPSSCRSRPSSSCRAARRRPARTARRASELETCAAGELRRSALGIGVLAGRHRFRSGLGARGRGRLRDPPTRAIVGFAPRGDKNDPTNPARARRPGPGGPSRPGPRPDHRISHHEMKPPLLFFVGTTVHFANTVAMPGGHVVIDEDGTLEVRLSRSPATAGTTPSRARHLSCVREATSDGQGQDRRHPEEEMMPRYAVRPIEAADSAPCAGVGSGLTAERKKSPTSPKAARGREQVVGGLVGGGLRRLVRLIAGLLSKLLDAPVEGVQVSWGSSMSISIVSLAIGPPWSGVAPGAAAPRSPMAWWSSRAVQRRGRGRFHARYGSLETGYGKNVVPQGRGPKAARNHPSWFYT